MRIHYLGTAAAEGIPGIFCNCENCRAARRSGGKNLRARSQVLIDDDLLVDFSPDTYLNSVRHGVELSRLRALLITHSHSDHFIPNELEMHGALFAKNLPHSFLDIYCNDRVYGIATRHMLQYGADYDAQEVTATLRFHQVMPMDRFTAAGCQVTALRAHHDANETCLIYLIEKEGKRILYANDTGIFLMKCLTFSPAKNWTSSAWIARMVRSRAEPDDTWGLQKMQLSWNGCNRLVVLHPKRPSFPPTFHTMVYCLMSKSAHARRHMVLLLLTMA